MMNLFNKILFIFIGLILLFLLFFPINYQRGAKSIETQKISIQNLFKIHHIIYKPELIYIPKNKIHQCYIIFPVNKEIISLLKIKQEENSCLVFIEEKQIFNDFNNTLNFLHDIYQYLEIISNNNVIIISEGIYNTLSLEIAAHYKNIKLLILKDEIYTSIPLIWNIIEPRICLTSKINCTKYKIIRYTHRIEMYERINQPIIWIVSEKEMINHKNINIKKSMEIFHQLGKSFSPRKIIFLENISNLNLNNYLI
ncbi:MAG: hypothetical protein KatS3mg129_0111 [Leptospiraceae bacterium]|nr:MAG: hypothetical protein KatS3mg129_0111 [Leptospiraceae bacterium]